MEVVSSPDLLQDFCETKKLSRLRMVAEAREVVKNMPVSQSKAPGKFYDFCKVLWLFVFDCTMRTQVSGLEALSALEGGMLISVSHVSDLEPIVVFALCKRRISWVSRIEFYRKWWSRAVLHHGGAFRVDRQGSALPTIREGLKRLARGEAVGIFPEGELMNGGNSVLRGAKTKRGVCTFSARSGCPVVPVVVLGTDRLCHLGPWLPAKRGKLWVKIGSPMQAPPEARTKTGRAEFSAKLEAEYVKLYAEARKEFGLPESIVP